MCLVNHPIHPLVRRATRARQVQRTTSQSSALTLVKTETVFTHIHGQRSYLDDFGLHYYGARWYDEPKRSFSFKRICFSNSLRRRALPFRPPISRKRIRSFPIRVTPVIGIGTRMCYIIRLHTLM